MSGDDRLKRGSRTLALWSGLWASLAILALVSAIDGLQRSIPVPVLALWFLPLLIVLPGVFRDRLRSVTWLSFISLLYFVLAVLRVFAEPGSLRSQIELLAVVVMFLTSMFYIRERARELRVDSDEATLGDQEE